MCRRNRAHSAAMKAVLQRQNFRSQVMAFRPAQGGVGARQFQRSLPCLGAAVAEKHPIQTRHFRQAESKLCLAGMVKEVGSMHQLSALLLDCSKNRGMTVAQPAHTDAAQQIEVADTVLIEKMNAFPANKTDRSAVVGSD